MKVICRTYFQDKDEAWHQPGSTWDVEPDSMFLKLKKVKPYKGPMPDAAPVIETTALEQPETRTPTPARRGRRRTT